MWWVGYTPERVQSEFIEDESSRIIEVEGQCVGAMFVLRGEDPEYPTTVMHLFLATEFRGRRIGEEALALAELLAGMFNLAPRHGQKSEFAGPYFECMKAPFHGKNGHIAMQTPDLESAVAELREKGFSFREETAAYDDAGKLKNIYLAGEYGGFAIHILRG